MKVHRIAAAVVTSVLLVAGCSSGSGGSSDDAAAGSSAAQGSSVPPESLTTTDAAVAIGLGKIVDLAGQIETAAATDSEAAESLADGLETFWRPIEGTVKRNDPDTYLAIEDAFANLESGDAAKSVEGAASVSAAVSKYLAANPG